MKPIVLTRRTTAIILSVSLVATIVGASIVANFLIPNQVTITTLPGVSADFCDAQTQAIIGPATSFNWGDIQQGGSKTSLFISIHNSQGSQEQWLISDGTADASGTATESFQTQNLPAFTTMTWNLPSLSGSPLRLLPGQRTQCLSVTYSVSTSASGGTFSFTIEIVTYSTSTG